MFIAFLHISGVPLNLLALCHQGILLIHDLRVPLAGRNQLQGTVAQPSNFVIADAVRIERLLSDVASIGHTTARPDIDVTVSDVAIHDDGRYGFGRTEAGTPVTETFTIGNDGGADLIVREPISIPAGFTLLGFTEPTGLALPGAPILSTGSQSFVVAPGESMTMRVRMDATIPGTFDGQIAFATGDTPGAPAAAVDPDAGIFNFDVTGSVSLSRIIDDQDVTGFGATAGFQVTGSGLSSEQGFGRSVHYANGDTSPVDTATWTFENLTAGGRYRVSATWSAFGNRATNAPFTISGIVGGSQTALVNQQQTPDDLSVNGTQFEDLRVTTGGFAGNGVFTVSGTTLTVSLTDVGADGQVIADAIRIQRVVDPEVAVAVDGVALADGQSTADFGDSQGPMTRTFTVWNVGDRPLFVGAPSMPDGFTNLAATRFPRTIPAGESFDFTVQLDGPAGAYDSVMSIPMDELDEANFEVRLRGDRRLRIDSDAERTAWIIDNEDPPSGTRDYSQIGFLNYSGQGRDGRDVNSIGTVDGSFQTNAADAATFTFSSLAPGLYRVSATWTAIEQNRASDAPYSIRDGATPLRTVIVNQRLAPDDFLDDGSVWEDLDLVRITSGTLVVQLTNGTDGDVVADAIRIEPLNQPEIEVIDLGADKTMGGADDVILTNGDDRVDFGEVQIGTTPHLTRRFRLVNHGTQPLDAGRIRLPLEFKLIGAAPATIPPASGSDPSPFVEIEVEFNPPRVDTFNGELRMVPDDAATDNSDVNESPFSITLSATAVPQVFIIDNDNAGYADVGLSGYRGQGFADPIDGHRDVDEGQPGGTPQSATWTFSDANGVPLRPNTTYRVSATWTAFGNRATNATYSIAGDIPGGPVSVSINQRLAPNDFSAAGADWDDLTIIRTDATGLPTVTVSLTDDADGNVIADAIRLEELPHHGPEILVQGFPSVVDGGNFDLGSTFVETTRQQTFFVYNMGTEPLTLDNDSLVASLQAAPGFSLITGFTPAAPSTAPLLPGESSTFTVQLDTTVMGNFSGTVNFDNNDADEGPFDFTLLGSVVPAVLIVDNDGPALVNTSYRDSGNLASWSQGYRNDVREAPAGGVIETATYEFNDLTPGDVFQVSATWTAFGNRATDAPYTISGVTPPATTVNVNQRLAPNDFQDAGTNWEDLGTYVVGSTGTMTVTISGSTTGSVIADAIRIERRTDPEIEVTLGTRNLASGTTINLGKVLRGSTTSHTFTVSNVGAGDLRLGETLTLPPGFTLGAVTQPGGQPTLFDQIPAPPDTETTNLAPGESATFEVILATAAVGSFGGVASFGNNDADEGPFNIALTAEVAGALIIDNDDPVGYSDTANMTLWGQGFQGDVREAVAGGTLQGATYRFGGLPAGTYRVSATWTPYSNRASNAPYTIGDTPVAINQRLSPSNPAATPAASNVLDAGAWFADLDSSFSFDGIGDLVVRVSDNGSNGNVIIDAIRVERLGALMLENAGARPANHSDTLTADQIEPMLRTAIDYWANVDPSAGEKLAEVQVIVTDLPPATLGLGSFVTPTIWLDDNGANAGWSLDAVPHDGAPQFGISPLAVITHELGHVLGLPDLDGPRHGSHVMASALSAPRLPVHRGHVVAATANDRLAPPAVSWESYRSAADRLFDQWAIPDASRDLPGSHHRRDHGPAAGADLWAGDAVLGSRRQIQADDRSHSTARREFEPTNERDELFAMLGINMLDLEHVDQDSNS